MDEAALASCGNCGAALRILPGQRAATCEYCKATSTLDQGHSGPTLRLGSQQPLPAGAGCGAVVGLAFAGAGLGIVLEAWLDNHIELGPGRLATSVAFLALALFGVWGAVVNGQKRAEVARLRNHGLPARATVSRLVAGQGRRATLELLVEFDGQRHQVASKVTIPQLMVPRLVDGFPLPVLVDPLDPKLLEIQWHLV